MQEKIFTCKRSEGMTVTESQQDHLTLEFPGYRLEWDLVTQQFSVWSQASA